jgi:HPt (histidine-containing phosphotransfer) domain-containing protein
VQSIDPDAILDREQLRDITMDDEELMREILATLLDDTSTHIHKLESAVHQSDSNLCIRLAHYCKGSCSNVGANAVASIFQNIERQAKDLEFQQCNASLAALATEMQRLRTEVTLFQ